MAEEEFNFEAEFALLDVGATSSLLRTGSVRPTVLAFTASAGVEAIALDWDDEASIPRAFEEARRCVRDLDPTAYALIAHVSRNGGRLVYHLPRQAPSVRVNEFLVIAMFAQDGNARSLMYPIRRTEGRISYGMPTVTDAETTDRRPLGDLWGNPFCVGDTVRFRPRERAVDPATPLWQTIVELTRMRIHEDQANADEYMAFLDDLRNGIFRVDGRPDDSLDRVRLRPRTLFNPLGTLTVEAARLMLADRASADVEKVATS